MKLTHAALTLLAASLLVSACDKTEPAEEKAAAVGADEQKAAEPASSGEEEEDDHHHDHAEGVHLGETMYELSRRFATVWFAGKAGNKQMVDYQIHEIEEVVEELEEPKPKEHGVDVHARLEADILPKLETIEEAVEAGDTAKFEETYRATISSCNNCHAMTEHDYVNVTVPEYNPYPNLAMEPKK